MFDYVLHLWSPPPAGLETSCPAAPGAEVQDLTGFFDPATVASAYAAVGYFSVLLVVALVLLCYLWTSTSLGPRFVRRWGLFLLASAVVCLLVALPMRYWPTTALAESCENSPAPFPVTLPWDVVMSRAMAGFVWGLLAFVLISLVVTRVAGRFPWSKGLFHNRGCPWPRLNPLAE